jgi:hypothetical protein
MDDCKNSEEILLTALVLVCLLSTDKCVWHLRTAETESSAKRLNQTKGIMVYGIGNKFQDLEWDDLALDDFCGTVAAQILFAVVLGFVCSVLFVSFGGTHTELFSSRM